MPVIEPPSRSGLPADALDRAVRTDRRPARTDRAASLSARATTLGLPRLDEIRTIVSTTASIMGSTIATSVLGFAFWWAAARTFDPAEVGLSSAAISAMLLLSKLGTMGLGTALAGTLPRHLGAPAPLLAAGVLAGGAIGFALGGAFALSAPWVAQNLAPLAGNALVILLFALGVALSAVGSVFDQGVIGLLLGRVQLYRNVVFAAAKLAALIVAGLTVPDLRLAILGTWVLGEVVSLASLAAVRRGRPAVLPRATDWATLGDLASHAVAHHALGVARYAPTLVMPILVAVLLSPEANATFYVTLLVASIVQLVSSASTFTLYAVARRRPQELQHQVRLTLIMSLGAVLPAIVGLTVLGGFVLGVFGPLYAEGVQPTLTILAAMAIPLIVKDHWIALQRIHDRLGRAAAVTTVGAVLEIAGALAGAAAGGVPGLAIGWLAGLALPAVAQLPSVVEATGWSPMGARRRAGS